MITFFYLSVFSSKIKLIKILLLFYMCKEALFTDLFGGVLNYVVPQPNRNIAHLQEKQCLNKGPKWTLTWPTIHNHANSS